MCFDYDDEPADAYTACTRKARTLHVCGGCYKPISPGMYYTAFSGIFDGSPFSGATCGSCELTRFCIHLHELIEGCGWHESWIKPSDINEYCRDSEFERSSQEDGQWHLKRNWEREKERMRAYRATLKAVST